MKTKILVVISFLGIIMFMAAAYPFFLLFCGESAISATELLLTPSPA